MTKEFGFVIYADPYRSQLRLVLDRGSGEFQHEGERESRRGFEAGTRGEGGEGQRNGNTELPENSLCLVLGQPHPDPVAALPGSASRGCGHGAELLRGTAPVEPRCPLACG